jgi:hypothetical protein
MRMRTEYVHGTLGVRLLGMLARLCGIWRPE